MIGAYKPITKKNLVYKRNPDMNLVQAVNGTISFSKSAYIMRSVFNILQVVTWLKDDNNNTPEFINF